MSNYPPGVTGNEPQITGEWPCCACGGTGFDEDEDGKHSCPHCKGAGVEPEEFDVGYIEDLLGSRVDKDVVESIVQYTRCCAFDRGKPEDRRYLKAVGRLRREAR